MFDREFNERIRWQTYRDRLREAEKNRLARQARAGVGSAAGGAAAGLRRRFFRAGEVAVPVRLNQCDGGLAVEGAPWLHG
jgi:hypothetical protein